MIDYDDRTASHWEAAIAVAKAAGAPPIERYQFAEWVTSYEGDGEWVADHADVVWTGDRPLASWWAEWVDAAFHMPLCAEAVA